MGDEVKITVIATGFRDQMPARRARMLSIGEVVMVEEPVLSVPVVNSGSWMNERPAPAPAKPNAPPPFLSEVDGDETADESEAAFFFSSSPAGAGPGSGSAAGGAAKGRTNGGVAVTEAASAADFGAQFGSGFGTREPELVAAAARPQFAEMAEESYAPLPRDYVSDFGPGTRASAQTEQAHPQPAAAVFPAPDEESHRDLDTPAFLRRLRF